MVVVSACNRSKRSPEFEWAIFEKYGTPSLPASDRRWLIHAEWPRILNPTYVAHTLNSCSKNRWEVPMVGWAMVFFNEYEEVNITTMPSLVVPC